MRFSYQAKKGPHERLSGEIEAASEKEAVNLIIRQGLMPISIQEVISRKSPHKKGLFFFRSLRRVTQRQLLEFSRQLYALLCARVELFKALYVLYEQSDNSTVKSMIYKIYDSVKGGGSFSAALEKFPDVFSSLYVSLIKAGELGGRLDTALERIVMFLEEKDDMRRKVISSIAYPIMMILVGIATVVVLITFVVPRLSGIFVDLGQDLPSITKMLLVVSSWLSRAEFWFVAAAVLVALAVLQRISRFKVSLNFIMNRVPFFHKIILLESISHFSYAFGMLLESGVSVLEALGVSGLSLQDSRLSDEVKRLKYGIMQGVSLADGAAALKSFPRFFRQMLIIGEESGLLPQVLETSTRVFKKELDMQLKIVSSLIEPVIILGVGLVLGLIVIALLLPIFQMSSLTM